MKAIACEPEFVYVEAGYVETGPPLIRAKVRIDCPPDDEEIELVAEQIRAAVKRAGVYARKT